MRTRRSLLVLAALALLGACGPDVPRDVTSATESTTTTTAPTTTTTTAEPSTTTTARRPATTAPTAPPAARCSAAGLSEDLAEPAGLPTTVAMMRKEILKAAVRCDYDLLQALALRGSGSFQYSFGQGSPSGAGRFWREREQAGEDVLAKMVKLLDLPHTVITVPGSGDRGASERYFAWPSAHRENPTEADWRALERVYPKEDVARWKAAGSYTGYRLGITQGGDWVYFVAGD